MISSMAFCLHACDSISNGPSNIIHIGVCICRLHVFLHGTVCLQSLQHRDGKKTE